MYEVQPARVEGAEANVFICGTCQTQIEDSEQIDPNHWRCLTDSMWTPVPAVQVLAWRMLKELKTDWSQDLLDMIYLEEDTLEWAKSLEEDAGDGIVHKDSNGVVLQAGDSVTLIKDLNVKGANFVAKRGTPVRRITLDKNNENHIEGKINGQHIVILTEYVKKTK